MENDDFRRGLWQSPSAAAAPMARLPVSRPVHLPHIAPAFGTGLSQPPQPPQLQRVGIAAAAKTTGINCIIYSQKYRDKHDMRNHCVGQRKTVRNDRGNRFECTDQ